MGAGPRDTYDFEVEVELAPGAIVSVRYQSVDEEGRDPDALENQIGTVAWEVVDAVTDLHARGAEALADAMHALRTRARSTLAGWAADGIHATLVDVRLVRTEFSGADDELAVEARLRCLDDRLRPVVTAVKAERPDLLEAQLADWKPRLHSHYALQAALARQGADGIVDRLTLNAIAQHWDVAKAAREFYGLGQELTLYMSDGRLRSHGRPPDAAFSWNRSRIFPDPCSIRDGTTATLSGRPVTDLLDHRVLSNDMIVSEVVHASEYGREPTHLRIEQPRLVFCGASGRVWAWDDETETEIEVDGLGKGRS